MLSSQLIKIPCRLLEEGNLSAAETLKLQLEQAQRDRRKRKEQDGIQHEPRWFRYVSEGQCHVEMHRNKTLNPISWMAPLFYKTKKEENKRVVMVKIYVYHVSVKMTTTIFCKVTFMSDTMPYGLATCVLNCLHWVQVSGQLHTPATSASGGKTHTVFIHDKWPSHSFLHSFIMCKCNLFLCSLHLTFILPIVFISVTCSLSSRFVSFHNTV